MNRRNTIDTSRGLEHQIAQSIERMRGNIERSQALRREIVKLRRQRRQIERIPDEVKQWFEETADYLDDDETGEL